MSETLSRLAAVQMEVLGGSGFSWPSAGNAIGKNAVKRRMDLFMTTK
jgi:hypothetical protein